MNPIFIFGMARSGTTWVQRVINSTHGALITGEHLGFLKGVAQSYYSFTEHRVIKGMINLSYIRPFPIEDMRSGKEFIACKANLSIGGLKNSFSKFVESVVNTYQVERWGFKEINYGVGDRVIEFLMELYPEARVIFLVRNPWDQICSKMSSGWWPQYSFDENIEIWRSQANTFAEIHHAHMERTRLYRYDDLIESRVTWWTDMFAFLGLELGKKQDELIWGDRVGETRNKVPLTNDQSSMILAKCPWRLG